MQLKNYLIFSLASEPHLKAAVVTAINYICESLFQKYEKKGPCFAKHARKHERTNIYNFNDI